MTCSKQNTAGSLHLAYDVASGRCAHYAILTEDQFLHTVCRADLQDQLADFGVPVPAIAADDKEAAIGAFWDRKQATGNERLAVMLLLEYFDFLAQTRS